MACAEIPDMQLQIGVHRLRDTTVVIPVGEIDIATSGLLKDCLSQCEGRVVVDLSGVTFLDSSGIGAFVVHRKRLSAEHGSLELRDPNPMARKAIEAVGLGAWIVA